MILISWLIINFLLGRVAEELTKWYKQISSDQVDVPSFERKFKLSDDIEHLLDYMIAAYVKGILYVITRWLL